MAHIVEPSEMPNLALAMALLVHRPQHERLPQEIEERARVCLLNGYGIALGCLGTPYAAVAARAAFAADGEQPDGATLLSDGRRSSIGAAALANSAPRAFEGRNGFVRACASAGCDVQTLAAQLGEQWSIRRVTFKPFPVCAFNQTPVHVALALREKAAGRHFRAVRVRMHPYEAGYAGMDSMGPFDSVSGTLMSIPCCISVTLLRGSPTMSQMTTYDDQEVNALVGRVHLQADEAVPRLCCAIEVDMDDGQTLAQEQRMTTADYAYDRAGVRALIRRVGAESGLPGKLYERIERVVDDPVRHFDEVFGCFEQARHVLQEAPR